MNEPGKHEIAPAELALLLKGELPSRLPSEGWRTLTLHGQLDAVGPSDRHPDLSKLEVSFPPAAPCRSCHGRGTVPDLTQWDSRRIPCPTCTGEVTTCSATMLHAVAGRVLCGRHVGHYDPSLRPGRDDPGGWHQSDADRDGTRFAWNDMYDAATPHGADPLAPAGPRPPQRVTLACPTCGPTSLENHPRQSGILRCASCKEHLARALFEKETP